MIPVTRPYLPSIETYQQYIVEIYKRQWLTNNGPLVIEFEKMLKEYLQVRNLLYVGNGTIALQMAIKALGLKREIITTPFSYVATTSSIVWENCTPVFVDIDEESLNIDAKKIEAAITSQTTGILATHCFGNACDIDAIALIAKNNNLKVIYDAAHCFGTLYKGKSIFEYGDVSTTSFHATKLMHSVEGGAVFAKDTKLIKKLSLMRNFGHNGPEKYDGVGINGKNSELHAAMGLCVLDDIEQVLKKRKVQSNYYDKKIGRFNVNKPMVQDNCDPNYAYYPIIFKDEDSALYAKSALEEIQVYPRRYFFPSLSSLNYVKKQKTPISDRISSSILCLPLFHDLNSSQQDMIVQVLIQTQNND